MGGAGFEPAKAMPSDLQSDPFDRSGNPPEITPFGVRSARASGGIRTHDRLITNQLLCQLSYAGQSSCPGKPANIPNSLWTAIRNQCLWGKIPPVIRSAGVETKKAALSGRLAGNSSVFLVMFACVFAIVFVCQIPLSAARGSHSRG